MRLLYSLLLLSILLLMPEGTPAASADDGKRARASFYEGMAALEQSRLDVAREAFARAAGLAPDWGLALLQWGLVEERLAPGSAMARECLEKAVALDPKNPRAHHQLGLLYQRRDLPAEAARELSATLALRPELLDAQFHLAAALRAQGDIRAALVEYQKVLESDPGHTGALVALAELYEQDGRLDDAENALIAITRVQPQVAYPHYQLGQFYARNGIGHKASQAFARAESLDPRPQRRMRQLR